MYKDDLQAAMARANEADSRAQAAEERAEIAESKISKQSKGMPFVLTCLSMIFGTGVLIALGYMLVSFVGSCFTESKVDPIHTCRMNICENTCYREAIATGTVGWKYERESSAVLQCFCFRKRHKDNYFIRDTCNN